MEWSFRYAGPKDPADNRDCPLCNTVARKSCLMHGAPQVGCPHCDAVIQARCPSHGGIALAFEHHPLHQTDPANLVWKAAERVAAERPADAPPRDERADVGKPQVRIDVPMDDARAVRTAQAAQQFEVVQAFVLGVAAQLPEGCAIEVDARGDADLPMNNPMNLEIRIKIP